MEMEEVSRCKTICLSGEKTFDWETSENYGDEFVKIIWDENLNLNTSLVLTRQLGPGPHFLKGLRGANGVQDGTAGCKAPADPAHSRV